jgi:CheY-like chemotaxis protein
LFDAVAAHELEAARAKGLNLRLRDGGLAVHADPVLLEQVVRNLVSNAVRHTERGSVLLSARRRGAGEVLLQVWDSGPGIPPEQQSLVFEEFVQLGNPARDASRGLGLGLSLVRRAAEVMRAPLTLRSVPGRGSCFSLRLPLAQVVIASPAPPQASPGGLSGRRVLVVDDDEGLRETLRLRLESWGAQVQAFAEVQALSAALARGAVPEPPHLLLSDQRLPDGDSRDVARLLAQWHPQVPVLVVTGDTAPADLARLDALGWPVLHKPFDSEALFAAVLRALRRPQPG